MAKTNITIVRFYDGTKTAGELMNEIIAYKVRKMFDSNIEKAHRKEYNLV